jgi:hypothetical protein
MRRAVYEMRMGEKKIEYKIFISKAEEKNPLGTHRTGE